MDVAAQLRSNNANFCRISKVHMHQRGDAAVRYRQQWRVTAAVLVQQTCSSYTSAAARAGAELCRLSSMLEQLCGGGVESGVTA